LQLSKIEKDMRMSLDITTKNMGVKYLDQSSCRDDLSISILRGLCNVLEERVVGNQHILHIELNNERLL
jgi:hypothetical protein